MVTRRNRTGESNSSVRRLQAEQRQRQAYYLRLAGAEFDDIAQQLDLTRSGAFRAVEAYRKKIYREDADATKALNLGRLNRLLLAVWRAASDPQNPDLDSIDRARHIIAEINKMLGLYEPVRVDLAYIRREAERIGEPYGLSADEVIAAAEELVSTRGR